MYYCRCEHGLRRSVRDWSSALSRTGPVWSSEEEEEEEEIRKRPFLIVLSRRKIPRHCLFLCTVCIVKYTQWKQKNVVLRLKMSKMLCNYHSWDIVFHICSTEVRSKIKILKINKEHTQPSSTKVHKINVLVDGVTRFWSSICASLYVVCKCKVAQYINFQHWQQNYERVLYRSVYSTVSEAVPS